MLSDLARERFLRFKRIKRSYYSLWLLLIAFVLSLFSEFIANDRPLYVQYQGASYFPVLQFYAETTFGGSYKTETNYKKLQNNPHFLESGGWMIFPPIPHHPNHPYLSLDGNPPHPPSSLHWLGTDSSARDVAARLLYGFRICMLFSLLLMVVSALVGILVGGIQGYLGGRTDLTLQRVIEIWSSLPFLYVVILLGAIYGRNFGILVLVMSLFSWIGLSYYMRGEFLKLKNQTYVQAARALGFSPMRIFFKQILPNALTPLISILPFSLIGGISALTGLDFLGFGLPPPTPSWGELMQQGINHLHAPWLAISSIMALFVTLLLATFIGEGVREAFDPKSSQYLE